MTEFLLPKPPIVTERGGNRAVFEMSELFPGYGVTVGNALRRVLYSSLPGAAITSVKIKGVPHEFSTIPNVFEDVLDLTLNLKQIRLRVHTDDPQTLYIKVKGKKEVKARDIEAPSQVEIVSPEIHIATLTSKGASLEMEMTAETGFGYMPSDQRKKEKTDVGILPLDAVFTPVQKVNFEVENMRVGDRTDYNRLRLEVVTDGSIAPEEALARAGKILVDHFALFEIQEKAEKKTKAAAGKKKGPAKKTAAKKTAKKTAKKK